MFWADSQLLHSSAARRAGGARIHNTAIHFPINTSEKTTSEIKVGIQSLVTAHIIQLTTDSLFPQFISLFSVYLFPDCHLFLNLLLFPFQLLDESQFTQKHKVMQEK